MKKLVMFISILFALVFIFSMAKSESGSVIISTPMLNSTISTTTWRHQFVKIMSQELILSIDGDGDIFLRKKWIGHDERFKKLLKSNGATGYAFYY